MKLFRVSALGLIAAAMTACASYDTDGEILTPDPVGGLRFINLVSDTGALDFRVVDVVSNAPIQVGATFRTGGAVNGVATTFMPPYQATLAGSRHVRVFLNSTNPAVAATVVYDTVVTITQGQNYTFYLYGTARAGSTPGLHSKMTNDVVPTLAAGKIAVRVLNLAPTLTGTPIAAPPTPQVDGRVGRINSSVPLPATGAAGANLNLGEFSAYAVLDTSGTATANSYRIAMTAAGSTSPILFQALMPAGTRGTSSANPIAGTAVTGTAITAIIVPRSVPGSTAPQTSASAVNTNIDSVIRSNDTVTVVRSLTGTAPNQTAVAAGVAAGDVIHLTGLTEPQYNGSHVIFDVVAGTSGASPVRSRFRFRIGGTPTSPATGTPSFKVVTPSNDFTAPTVLFAIDQQPPRTAP